MFKNCVFKPNVNTVEWLKKAGIRAVKTMAQTAVAVIGTGQAQCPYHVRWSYRNYQQRRLSDGFNLYCRH